MIDISSIIDLTHGSFTALGIAMLLMLSIIALKVSKDKEEKPSNYKNIAQMAQNLSICKVSTRMTVLKELKEDPKWTDEELHQLISVLEGMLDTEITLTTQKGKAAIKR